MTSFPVQGPQGSEYVDLGASTVASGIGSAGPSTVQALALLIVPKRFFSDT